MNREAGNMGARVRRVWQTLSVMGLMLALIAPTQATRTMTSVLTNAQGTVVATMDAAGNVTYTAAYRPYGKQQTGTPQAGPGYTGHVNDPDTGLVYMQARYYDPSGRFLSVDPVAPTPGNIFSFNRYTYTYNNPIRYTDPNGMCPPDAASATCIEATHAASSSKENVLLSSKDEAFASQRSTRMKFAAHGKTWETVRAIVGDSKNNPTLAKLQSAATNSNYKGWSATGKLPKGATAVMHGHVANSLISVPGLGDSAVVVNNHLPNITVSGDGRRAGVHESENGKLQFRMIHGKMTPNEQKVMLEHLNQA